MRSALQLRRSLAIAREEPVNIYDVAAAIGVEVQFRDLPSLEGMFSRDPHPTVVLPSHNHRPRGRLTFTCAHELGHFQLGHGTRVDEYLDGDADLRPKPDEEFAADTFAASLLMPRQAVLHRFQLRDATPSTADPKLLFAIAGELDVGYQTLLMHICYRLEMANNEWLRDRQRTAPKRLRADILGSQDSRRLVLLDRYWPRLPLDLEVGDVIATPSHAHVHVPPILIEATLNIEWRLFRACRPGMAMLHLDDSAISIRVARAGYCGLLKYRFLDDPEAE